MDEKENLLAKIKDLLGSQLFGVLSTRGPEYPYGSLVCYTASQDAAEIYFATIRDTRKYSNLEASSRVSLLIDNQTNQMDDFSNAHALTIVGSAAEVEAESLDDARSLYLQKHPYLEDFVCAPNCALIAIRVHRYISVTDFQRVMEYTMP